jgi:TRAP-type transport system periplasmic protein
VKYSYQDHQYVGQYMPLITEAFWGKLTPDLQKMMLDLWAENIPTYRANAAASQDRARKLMADNNVQFIDPSEATLDAARKAMQGDVATLISASKLSPEIVKLAEESANGSA